MAPMRLLCGSVLRSLVVTSEEAPQESPPQIATPEETNPEDSEDEAPRRRRQLNPEIVEGDLNENPKTIDLRGVFMESTSWTSILV